MCPEDPGPHAVTVIFCDYRWDWLFRGLKYGGCFRSPLGSSWNLFPLSSLKGILTRREYLGVGIAADGSD